MNRPRVNAQAQNRRVIGTNEGPETGAEIEKGAIKTKSAEKMMMMMIVKGAEQRKKTNVEIEARKKDRIKVSIEAIDLRKEVEEMNPLVREMGGIGRIARKMREGSLEKVAGVETGAEIGAETGAEPADQNSTNKIKVQD